MSTEPDPAVPATAEELPVLLPEAPEAPARHWLRSLRPYPFEWVTLASILVAFVFLRAHGLRMDWAAWNWVVLPPLGKLPVALGTGIGLQLLYRLATRRPLRANLRAYLREVVRPRWWLLWLRLMLALVLMQYGYFWMKVSVPLVNPRLWDHALWNLDTWLHFGLSPSVFMVNLFAGTPLVSWLDLWYSFWISTVFYTLTFWSAGVGAQPRCRILLSSILLWTLGSWLYVGVPALGPAYLAPQTFDAVRGELPGASGGQQVLRENYGRMIEGRRGGSLRQFNPTRGIAAMPSLHVGAHFLFFLWARRRARPLAVFFALATFLTFLGSILTGWHYAVDGYAGMLLAWICYRIGCWGDGADPVGDPAFPRRGL
jgi:hypothetical protein